MTTEEGRNRVRQLTEEIADSLGDIKDRLDELRRDHLVEADEALDLATPHLAPEARSYWETFGQTAATSQRTTMEQQIDALFAEAPAPIDGTAPAIADVHVVLRGSVPPLRGTLTKCPTGALKLGTIDDNGKGQVRQPVLIETFFSYSDVVAIAVQREVKATVPRIFTGS